MAIGGLELATATEKLCTKCETSKPLEQFHRSQSKSLGRANRCKACCSAYHRRYYQANREAILERTGEYQRTNREQVRKYVSKYNVANREKRRKYSEEYRSVDPERVRIQRAMFRERNPDKNRRDAHARRALLADVTYDPCVTLESLRERDGDFCCYCSVILDFNAYQYASNRANVEHITPLSRGGNHAFDNTAISCRACNLSKNKSLFLTEWVGRRNRKAV